MKPVAMKARQRMTVEGDLTVSIGAAGVADLYAAAVEFEPDDASPLNGLPDNERVSVITTAGAVRRLQSAIDKMRFVEDELRAMTERNRRTIERLETKNQRGNSCPKNPIG